MTTPTLNRRLTVDLRPGGKPPEPEYRDHPVLAAGLLDMVVKNQIQAKVSGQILESFRRRWPGRNDMDEALLQQVRLAYNIKEPQQ